MENNNNYSNSIEQECDRLLYSCGYDKSEIDNYSLDEKIVICNNLNLIPMS